MGSGLFDRHPNLNILLGHLGELLPFNIWRTDHRIAVTPRGIDSQHSFGHYLRNNFYLTTSGNFRTPALLKPSRKSAPTACCSPPTTRSRTCAKRPIGSTDSKSTTTTTSRSHAPTHWPY